MVVVVGYPYMFPGLGVKPSLVSIAALDLCSDRTAVNTDLSYQF